MMRISTSSETATVRLPVQIEIRRHEFSESERIKWGYRLYFDGRNISESSGYLNSRAAAVRAAKTAAKEWAEGWFERIRKEVRG